MNNEMGYKLELLLRDVSRSQVSRRQFLQTSGALGLGATAPSLWAQTAYATPKKGGTFRAGLSDGSTTDSLDPATTASLYMIQLGYAFRTYLTETTPSNQVGPDSAQSWESSPDAKVWKFKLFRGQQFHNGKTLTASDVVASINYHRRPGSTSGAKTLLKDIADISADGVGVVVIKLSAGMADLPYLMADYHFPIMPGDGNGGIDWGSGIGAGPYKIIRFQPGIGAELTRHDRYHRPDQAYFDALHLMVLNDVNARQTALLNNEADAIVSLDLRILPLLSRNRSVAIDEVAGGSYNGMPMNCLSSPFKDPNVRLALKYALNREEIIAKIMNGHATVGNDQPVSPIMPYAAKIPQRHYDPDKAKFYLRKAGLDSLKVQLSTSDAAGASAVDMAVLFAQGASKAGIDIGVVRESADGYWSNVWLKKPFVVVNAGQRPTPDVVFSQFFEDGAAWNDTHWHNDRFQSLLLTAKSMLDQKRRSEIYAEMQAICSDDGGYLIPFFANKVSARRSNVKHTKTISSAWELDGGRAYQRWWFGD